jgi:spore coat protein U-like protein
MVALEPCRLRAGFVLGVMLVAAWLWPQRADAACTLSVSSSVTFGAYNVFNGSPLDSTGQFSLRCNGGDRDATFSISLSRGGTGTYTARRLTSGAEFLLYNLYRDAARTIVWGDGTGGTQVTTGQYNGVRLYFSVFGRIPALQDAAVGTYSDTVTVIINF